MKNTALNHHLLKSFQELQNDVEIRFAQKHHHAWNLLQKEKNVAEHYFAEGEKLAAAGILAGSLVMSSEPIAAWAETLNEPKDDQDKETTIQVTKPLPPKDEALKRAVKSALPSTPQPLPEDTSAMLTLRIQKLLNITAVSELDGFRLNTDYGFMGAEQHLPRFPGDALDQHDEYQASGITPQLGAFGYFANSKEEMTEETNLEEKYYVAVQSFLSPQYQENVYQYKNWLKHRKVLVINPSNGKAVVGVIGDAGPAEWTNKQFGGSPEIVHYLNSGTHHHNTPVVMLFIDDQENNVPLGPVN
ncbi:hypothetical protein KC571_03410 [candidate division WWE3 bacterium]|uniref:Uncharacterized protein n=1 Tax=candidate division WWE3 bacterium TaxID=2053526 RepID=A0A955LH96_UNCKA|nr:hypothetical protein [candidate division WWE3 bacterium]